MPKIKYAVYMRRVIDAEELENCIVYEWEKVGETYAISEKQAINNVRFRKIGNKSQYKPIETSGHYDVFVEWKAKEMIS